MVKAIGCALLLVATAGVADEGVNKESAAFKAGKAMGEAIGAEIVAAINAETERCQAMPGEADRVSCLNSALELLGMDTPAEVHGLWVSGVLIDPMTDEVTGSASVEAEPERDAAKLSVRCLRGEVDVFVTLPSTTQMPPASEPVSVRTRIDSEEPEVTEWRMANVSPNSAFYKGDIVGFANRLAESERLVLELASSDGTGVEVFDTRKAAAAFERFREPCGW